MPQRRLKPPGHGATAGQACSYWSRERWILCIQVAYPAPEIFVRAVTGHRWDTEAKKRSRVKRDQGYEIAVRMFQREHDRWIHNALVFFGSLVSAYLICETLEDLMPISAVLALALIIAFVTVCVSLSIRGTSDAWRDTIRTIEELPPKMFVRSRSSKITWATTRTEKTWVVFYASGDRRPSSA